MAAANKLLAAVIAWISPVGIKMLHNFVSYKKKLLNKSPIRSQMSYSWGLLHMVSKGIANYLLVVYLYVSKYIVIKITTTFYP